MVEPAAAAALRPGAPVPADAAPVAEGLYLDHIRLAGGPYSPDTRLQVDWVWVAQADHPGPIAPEVVVRSAAGAIVATSERAQLDSAAGPVAPLSRLRAGERVRDHLELPLRSIREPGAYSVELRIAPDGPRTPLGEIEVAIDPSRYRRPELPQGRSA